MHCSIGLLGGEKLWAGDVVLAAPLIMRQVTIQVVSVKNMSPEARFQGIVLTIFC